MTNDELRVSPAKKPALVAHLGPIGTYSHEITQKTFPEPDYQLIPYHTISATIYALLGKEAEDQPSLAVVPIENSSFGPVEETHDILKEPSVMQNTVMLDEKLKLKIQHCLVARKNHAAALSPQLENHSTQKILSHVQALGQCKNYIGLHYPNSEQVSTSSTTEAAEVVSKDLTYSSLAICSASCLNYFPELKIIDSNIQDAGQENITTFIVLKKIN